MVTTLLDHQTFLQDVLARQTKRRQAVTACQPSHSFKPQPELSAAEEITDIGQPSKSNVVNYVPEEETIRNDYAAWYGVSGEVGANYILGAADHEICEE